MNNISPLERVSPTIEFSGLDSIVDLKQTISAIDSRVWRTKKEMRTIRLILSNQDRIDWRLVEEYQGLNEQLRALEVYKAEFRYHKRML